MRYYLYLNELKIKCSKFSDRFLLIAVLLQLMMSASLLVMSAAGIDLKIV